jgi:hypothetical protein
MVILPGSGNCLEGLRGINFPLKFLETGQYNLYLIKSGKRCCHSQASCESIPQRKWETAQPPWSISLPGDYGWIPNSAALSYSRVLGAGETEGGVEKEKRKEEEGEGFRANVALFLHCHAPSFPLICTFDFRTLLLGSFSSFGSLARWI